jgi:tetratricopeptide (TPR) repeat protein
VRRTGVAKAGGTSAILLGLTLVACGFAGIAYPLPSFLDHLSIAPPMPVRVLYGLVGGVFVVEGLGALMEVRRPIVRATLWLRSQPARLLPYWDPTSVALPPRDRSSDFVNRVHELGELGERLRTDGRVNLTGLPGVGKTWLALEYRHRQLRAGAYPGGVFWIRGASAAGARRGIASLTWPLLRRRILLPRKRRMLAALRALRERQDWLLVVDDADDRAAETLRALVRDLPGHVVLVSRRPLWTDHQLAVEPMAPAVATELLLTLSRQRSRWAARIVARALGGLPLRLGHVVTHLRSRRSQDLDDLAGRPPRVARIMRERPAPSGYGCTPGEVYDEALDGVRRAHPVAAALLELCSFLTPGDLPLDLLRDGSSVLPRDLRRAAGEPQALDAAAGVLQEHGLANGLHVSDLDQRLVRHRLKGARRKRRLAAAIRLLHVLFPADVADPASRERCVRLVPHVRAAMGLLGDEMLEPRAASWLLDRMGAHLRHSGDLPGAEEALERALAIRRRLLWPDRVAVASSLNNLGLVLQEDGRLDEAGDRLEEALDIYARQLGPDHPDTATALDNLAGVRRDQGELDAARLLFEQAVEVRERAHGPHDPTTAISLNNLAGVVGELHDVDGACSLYERALAIFRSSGHPHADACERNLAALREAMEAGAT